MPGGIGVKAPHLHGGAGGRFRKIDGLPGNGMGGDARNRGWKQRMEQRGLSGPPGAGEDQMALTAAPESLPDTAGG